MSLTIHIRTNAWPETWSEGETCEPQLAQKAAEVLLSWLIGSTRAHWPRAEVSGEVECVQPGSKTRLAEVTYGNADQDAQDHAALDRIAQVIEAWQDAQWTDALQVALEILDKQEAE